MLCSSNNTVHKFTDCNHKNNNENNKINNVKKKQYKKSNNNSHCLGPLNCKGLKICHLNIRSLLPKIDEVKMLIKESNIDVLAISETWLSNIIPDSFVNIKGYNLYRKDRLNTMGGGVAIFIKENITHTIPTNLTNDMELIHVQIKLEHRKPFMISCVYRPPSASSEYLENIIECLTKASGHTDDHIVLGDFNINFDLSENIVYSTCHYIEHMLGAKQLIMKPTRVTETSKTIIDHIYTTMHSRHTKSGVIELCLSDHYMIYTVINYNTTHLPPKTVTSRNYNNFNSNQFLNDLSNCQSLNIKSFTDVDKAWSQWKLSFLQICNKHAPIRSVRLKERYNPWITDNIV